MQTSSYNLQRDEAILSISSELRQTASLKVFSNIMVRQIFSSTFKKPFWQQISTVDSLTFITKQKQIFNLLISNQEDFEAYFLKFYNNHTELYHWYVLASEKHQQMKNYIFYQLLKKSIKQYRSDMKDIVTKKKNQKIQTKKLDISKFCIRSTPDSPKKKFLTKKQDHKKQNNYNKKCNFSQNFAQQQNEDYHQLFMNTLQACSGSKYIHYNFIKHQQGYESRGKYNNFIRIKKKDSFLRSSNMNEQNMYKTFNTPFRLNYYEQDNDFPKNIASMYQSFYQSPKIVEKPNSQKCQRNKQNNSKYNAFILTPIGSAKKMDKPKKKMQIQRKSLVIKKLPNRFGKQKIRQPQLSQTILRELQMPLLI